MYVVGWAASYCSDLYRRTNVYRQTAVQWCWWSCQRC